MSEYELMHTLDITSAIAQSAVMLLGQAPTYLVSVALVVISFAPNLRLRRALARGYNTAVK